MVRTLKVAGNPSAHSPHRGDRPIAAQAWLPLNVSIDPIIGAGHRGGCGYRCGDEAATRGSENARLGYA